MSYKVLFKFSIHSVRGKFEGFEKSADPDQTAPEEQSDKGMYYLAFSSFDWEHPSSLMNGLYIKKPRYIILENQNFSDECVWIHLHILTICQRKQLL